MTTYVLQLRMGLNLPESGWYILKQSEKLKFKIDENLPGVVAEILREAGFDAETVLQEGLGGAPDESLASVCKEEGRVLVTLDLDFSDIRTYPPDEYPGFIVFRLHNHSIQSISQTIRKVVGLFSRERLTGTVWSVDERRIRIYGD